MTNIKATTMNRQILKCFVQLVRREATVFIKDFLGKFIDAAILLVTTVIIFSYFMPEFGLDKAYGSFILIGAVASFGFFENVSRVITIVADISGDKTISYMLTLPVPSWMVFCSLAVGWACCSSLLTLLLFPLGKLILMSGFDIGKALSFSFALMFITANLFFGFFSLWLAGCIKNMRRISSLWVRVVTPIYMFGGYFYSWESAFGISTVLGWVSLINPMVYVMEGMRGIFLGQEGFISLWICIGVLWAFIVFCAWDGTRRLRKRLDCV